MKRILLSLGLLILAVGAAFAAGAEAPFLPTPLPPVEVHLTSLGSPQRVSVRPVGPLRALDYATGQDLALPDGMLTVSAEGARVRVGSHTAARLRLSAVALTVDTGRIARTYPGTLIVTAAGGKLALVNECDIEAYTAGVLAGECPALFHPEAIRAMAVAARSYCYRKAYLGAGTLCDTTHCQSYVGIGAVKPSIQEGVDSTEGHFALYEGEVIDAVYSADCGGYTEANEDAWPGTRPLAYLRPVEDAPEPHGQPYCSVNRSHHWTLPVSSTRLQALRGGGAGPVRISVDEFTESGRVRRLRLGPRTAADAADPAAPSLAARVAASAERVYSGEEWRRVLGPDALRSLHFDVRETASGVELIGRGYGHGVGLCQFGAHGMGQMGDPFDAILRHYYLGIEIAAAPTVEESRALLERRRNEARRMRQASLRSEAAPR